MSHINTYLLVSYHLMEIPKIKWCIYVSNLSNFSTKHYFINTMPRYFFWHLFPVSDLWITFPREILDIFFHSQSKLYQPRRDNIWIYAYDAVFVLHLCLIFRKEIVCGPTTMVTWGCFAMMRCVKVLPFFIWLKNNFVPWLWKHWYIPTT